MSFTRLAPAAVAAALALPGMAAATTFSGSYAVTANGSDPGLVVHTAGPGSFATPDLAVGESTHFNLFSIWTDESDVGGDDTAAKPISVAFSFLDPTGVSGDTTADGSTFGERILGGFIQDGKVTWDGPLTLSFGGTGQFTLALDDATFNKGFFGLDEGMRNGASVGATLSYDVAPVPLPATLPLLLGGLGLVGAVRRRLA